MALVQLILIVIVLCIAVTAVVFSLFSAPWYALFGVLVLAFGITRWLMPTSTTAIALSNYTLDPAQPTDNPTVAAEPTADSPHLSYRGAPYREEGEARSLAVFAGGPLPMSYRGAKYDRKHKAEKDTTALELDSTRQLDAAEERQTPAMKYRGVKVN